MSVQSQEEYFRRRARQCRRNAETAPDKMLRKVHLEFARRYEEAAAQEAGQLPSSASHPAAVPN